MKYFDRGDIVRVSFEPSIGHEMKGETRLALVLTTKEFNQFRSERQWRWRSMEGRWETLMLT